MANSAVVGTLRAVLTADTAQFTSAMARVSDDAKKWTNNLKDIGRQATALGLSLTKTLTLPIVGLGVASAKAAIDFESSFAGIRKTVDATEAQFGELAQGMRDLAKTIPINVNELNKIGEAAGQLGIKTENILGFTEVMAKLGVTTNLSSEQAATALARLANITQMPQSMFDRLGSTIVALGNNFATTESEIVDFGVRIAGAGKIAGLTEHQILAIGAAMASVGVEAEAGGTAVQKVLNKMTEAVATGNKSLAAFAKTAEMSAQEFAAAFKKDAGAAFAEFVKGLGREGDKAFVTLKNLGLSNERVIRAFLSLANAGDLVTRSLETGATAWRENTALTEEARRRFETTASQLTLLWNRITDVGITIGNALLPAIQSAISLMNVFVPVVDALAKGFGALPGFLQLAVVGVVGLVAAIGPAIWAFGQLATAAAAVTAGFTTKGIVTRLLTSLMPAYVASTQAAAAANTTLAASATATTASMTLLSRAWMFATGPIGLLIGSLTALGFIAYKVATAETELEKSIRENSEAFRTQTRTLEETIRTFTTLRGQQNLTAEETKKLDAATRALAEASGLSKEAFEREAAGSNVLIDSLREQLKARKELLAEAVAQAREEWSKAVDAIARAQAQLNRVLSGKGTVFETVGDSHMQARDMSVAERVEEVEKLNRVIAELSVQAKQAETAYKRMAGIVGGDVALPAAANSMAAAAAAAGSYAEQLRLTLEAVKLLTPAQREEIEAAQKLGISLKDIAEKTGVNEVIIRQYTSAVKALNKELDKMRVKGLPLADKVTTQAMAGFLGSVRELKPEIVDLSDLSSTFIETWENAVLFRNLEQEFDRARASAEELGRILSGIPRESQITFDVELTGAERFKEQLFGFIDSIAAQLPDVILRAIQGGGQVGKAIGTFFGGELGKSIQKPFGDWFGKSMWNTFGSMSKDTASKIGNLFGSFMPIVGSLLGGMLGKGVDALIGAFRGKGAKANDLRDAIKESLGGDVGGKGLSDRVFAAFDAAGLGSRLANELDKAYTAFLQADTPAKVERAAARMAEIFSQIERQQVVLQGHFQSLSGAFDVFGGRAPAALRPVIQELLTLNGLTAEQRLLLDDLLKPAGWKEIQAAFERLGIDIKHAGQEFHQARLSEQALQFARDLALVGEAMGGAISDDALREVSAALIALGKDAIANMGILPDTLQPFFQRMKDLGLLVDENGNALIDFGQLQFGAIVDDQLERIADILEAIKDLLAGLPAVAGQAAQGINEAFGRVRPPDIGGWPGFRAENFNETPSFATGTHGAYLRAGGLAMLHANEAVVPRSDTSELARDIAAAMGGGATNITVVAWDGKSVDDWLKRGGARLITHHVARATKNNDGGGRSTGPRTEMREGLGIT